MLFIPIIVITSIVMSFLPNYCHSFQIIVIPSVLLSFLLQKLTVPKGGEKWPPEVAI